MHQVAFHYIVCYNASGIPSEIVYDKATDGILLEIVCENASGDILLDCL